MKPLFLEADEGEKRPLGIGWMLSGRGHAIGLPVVVPYVIRRGNSVLVYNVPSTNKETMKIKSNNDKAWNKRIKKWNKS